MEFKTRSKKIEAGEGTQIVGTRTDNMKFSPDRQMTCVNTKKWLFTDMLGVKQFWQTVDINSSIPISVVTEFLNNPDNIGQTFSGGMENVYTWFAYMRYNVEFTLEVQSTFQQQGLLALRVLPYRRIPWTNLGRFFGLPAQSQTGTVLTDIRFTTIVPHDFITLGHNGTYVLTLPWTCNRLVLPVPNNSQSNAAGPLLTSYSLNTLQLVCCVPMQIVAGGNDSATFKFWIRLTDLEFDGYRGMGYVSS